VLAAACSNTQANPAPGPSVGRELHRQLPSAVLDIRFTDSAGRRVTLASLRGEVVVISDMLTLCQGTCPLDTAELVAAARRVDATAAGKRVVFLSVTLDPRRDTLRRLTAYRRQYSPAPSTWSPMTAPPSELNLLWKTLGVFRKRVPDKPPLPRDSLTHEPLTYDITHSDEVFFIDASGRERFVLQGAPHITPGLAMPPGLTALMAADAGSRTPPSEQEWISAQAVQVIGWLLDKHL
jgi:protein SCO1/2